MFTKTSVAVVAGMVAAGSLVVAPGVAAPTVSGRLAAWGYNPYGQVGDTTFTDRLSPVPVGGELAGKSVTEVAAGGNHSCAVADGRVYCWGYNASGQVGDGTTSTDRLTPVEVAGVLAGRTVTAVEAGSFHSCAVADGQAYCWGSNGYGRVGDGTSGTNRLSPVAVAGVLAGRTVTAVAAGTLHSCAVADARAFCWGYNADGRVGDGTSGTNRLAPVSVDTSGPLGGRTVTAVDAGGDHSCAVAEGRVSCWGNNAYGQVGDGTSSTNRLSPVPVDTSGPLAGKSVTAVAAGDTHSCAVADGQAYCWGFNGDGQVGDGTSDANRLSPVPVDTSGPLAGRTVTAVAAGYGHSVAVAAGVPEPPVAVGGVAGDRQASVSWSPPADDGGSPVLDYTATAVPGGATCTTTGTSCVVTGLANGTPYTVTVTARNLIGVSGPSALSAPVTPTAPTIQPPAKVKGVKATVRKGKVKVTWKAVAGATSYRVRISKLGGKTYKAWKTTNRLVFRAKVRKGTKYRFQVTAVNTGGRGPVTTIRFKGK